MHVGLERKQLEILADVETLKNAGKAPIKLSRRDIAPAMSLGRYGGTTIAGTTVLAHLAGIKVRCSKLSFFETSDLIPALGFCNRRLRGRASRRRDL
jgi:hypothetical protein